MTISDHPTIGWIGTGRMGAALVERLLKAGYDVSVYNRTRSKTDSLVSRGARVVESPVELADRDIVFTMVSAPKDLEAVTIGVDGVLTSPDHFPGVLIDSSTVSIAASSLIRAAANKRGSQFLASPVSGNPAVISAGKLTVASSGPRSTFHEVEPVLATLGRGVTYVGEGEVARLVKICHNVLLGVVTQSLAEIVVLAEKGGVSREAFLSFLNDSVMGSTFTKYKTPAFVNLDFTPTFTMPLLRKDFDLGLAAAKEYGVAVPVTALTAEIVSAAIGAGHLTDDFATLLIEEARNSGLELVAEDVEVDDGLNADAA
jgi:3-hydroxyisobutyrate dehydrogenase